MTIFFNFWSFSIENVGFARYFKILCWTLFDWLHSKFEFQIIHWPLPIFSWFLEHETPLNWFRILFLFFLEKSIDWNHLHNKEKIAIETSLTLMPLDLFIVVAQKGGLSRSLSLSRSSGGTMYIPRVHDPWMRTNDEVKKKSNKFSPGVPIFQIAAEKPNYNGGDCES